MFVPSIWTTNSKEDVLKGEAYNVSISNEGSLEDFVAEIDKEWAALQERMTKSPGKRRSSGGGK